MYEWFCLWLLTVGTVGFAIAGGLIVVMVQSCVVSDAELHSRYDQIYGKRK